MVEVVAPAHPHHSVNHPVITYDVILHSPQDDIPLAYKDSSLPRLLLRDLGIVTNNIHLLPLAFYPLPLIGTDITLWGLFMQFFLTIASLVLTTGCLTAFAFGMPTPIIAAGVVWFWTWLYDLLQGTSRIAYQTEPGEEKHPEEIWIFVNGVATSKSGLILILNRLYSLFGRRVVGVHNRTNGIWFDLIECLIQRDLLWPTTDSREGYIAVSKAVAANNKKVVLMSHSQGGIILSGWVDQLLADFSASDLKKVEIYTFASAANHFSVPSTNFCHSHSQSSTNGAHSQTYDEIFGKVEHFVNTKDFVSRIGLIPYAPPPPENAARGNDPVPVVAGRFAGRIFQRLGHTGHLLLSHYLLEGDSILDDVTVRNNSKLVTYLQT